MKFKALFILFLAVSSCATSKGNKDIEGVYEVACGSCIFDMTGDGCDLAILIDDKHYYIEGSGISDHGDEHASDGLCKTSRKAQVKGRIKFGVFMADYVKLIEE
jgi:hypothetical protein